MIVLALTITAVILVAVSQFGLFKSTKTSAQTFTSIIPSTQIQIPSVKIEEKKGKPTSIRLPSVSIDLPLLDGVYNASNKTWSLSNDAAHYALMTPIANNIAGNTFIYGHNKKNVFAKLSSIKNGDKAYIATDTGLTFVYSFRTSLETDPNDDTLFHYEGAPILTLQTCSGLWYQNRQLFTFDLIEVVKS